MNLLLQYSVVGKLEEGVIEPYITTTGVSQKVLLVYKGHHNLEEAFKQEHRSQRLTTWGFRFFGWMLLFFAITCTSNLFQILCKRTLTNVTACLLPY